MKVYVGFIFDNRDREWVQGVFKNRLLAESTMNLEIEEGESFLVEEFEVIE